MTHTDFKNLSTAELVRRFATIGIEQDEAMREGAYGNTKRYNRLCLQMEAVENELKGRPGDQRGELLVLYNHPNMQVRLMAAKLTLAVAPEAARSMLQQIEKWGRQPQAGDAGISLWNIDRGVFVPK